MNEVKLADYLKSKANSQRMAAILIGCKQPSVAKMLAKKRDVRLVFDASGAFVRSIEVRLLSGAA